MFAHGEPISGFAVSDKDLEKARDFYRDVLELDVEMREGYLLVKLIGGARALVYPKPNHEPASFTVLNLPVDDIDKAVDELTARGVKFEIYGDPRYRTDARGICRTDMGAEGPVAMAWFRDPSGNIIALAQDE